jgi:hypothetical protein
MSYFQNTTDASDIYRPTSAAAGTTIEDTAVKGNLADMMRHGTVYKATFVVPKVVQHTPYLIDTNTSPTSSVVW